MLIDSEPLKAWLKQYVNAKEVVNSASSLNVSLGPMAQGIVYMAQSALIKIAELEQEQDNKLPCGHEINCAECSEEIVNEATKKHGW